ncbi:MAG: hypothetical protein ACKPCI_20380 [Dolichospermum sp.]
MGCDRLKLGGCERSLFEDIGCDRFGDIGVRSFKIGVVMSDRYLGMLGCDRFWDVGVRSLFLGYWVRSLFGV